MENLISFSGLSPLPIKIQLQNPTSNLCHCPCRIPLRYGQRLKPIIQCIRNTGIFKPPFTNPITPSLSFPMAPTAWFRTSALLAQLVVIPIYMLAPNSQTLLSDSLLCSSHSTFLDHKDSFLPFLSTWTDCDSFVFTRGVPGTRTASPF